MTKKILAAMLAALMLFCMTGCEGTTDKSAGDMLTLDEFAQAFDVALQQQEESTDSLSLRVKIGLRNSDELLDFMNAMTQGAPVNYVNTLKEYSADGVLRDVMYTIVYDGGTSATITREIDGAAGEPLAVAGFSMVSMAQLCTDTEGNFDVGLFSQLMSALDMEYWVNNYPYHMIYGVNAIVAVTVDGQYMLFDYYFDSSIVSMLG